MEMQRGYENQMYMRGSNYGGAYGLGIGVNHGHQVDYLIILEFGGAAHPGDTRGGNNGGRNMNTTTTHYM